MNYNNLNVVNCLKLGYTEFYLTICRLPNGIVNWKHRVHFTSNVDPLVLYVVPGFIFCHQAVTSVLGYFGME